MWGIWTTEGAITWTSICYFDYSSTPWKLGLICLVETCIINQTPSKNYKFVTEYMTISNIKIIIEIVGIEIRSIFRGTYLKIIHWCCYTMILHLSLEMKYITLLLVDWNTIFKNSISKYYYLELILLFEVEYQ